MFLPCINVSVTPSDQLLSLVDQVRGHFTVTHELLEAQKVQTASPQTEEQNLLQVIYWSQSAFTGFYSLSLWGILMVR